MAKDYTYDLIDVVSNKIVYQDITRPEIILAMGNVNFGACFAHGALLQERYLVKRHREFERVCSKADGLFAALELECRKFRGLEWNKTEGFDLARAWRRWKEQNKGGGKM